MKKLLGTCFLIMVIIITITACGATSSENCEESNTEEITTETLSTSATKQCETPEDTTVENIVDNKKEVFDKDGNFTEDAKKAIDEYLFMANNGWYRHEIKGFDLELSTDYTVVINGIDTGERTDAKILYDVAVELYLNGEWDGMPKTFVHNVVELAPKGGYVLCDNKILCGQKNLDLPNGYSVEGNNSNYTYVPGEGTYIIVNHKLVKYVRGNEISIPGEELSWKGSYYGNDDARLVYSVYGKTLYLLTYNPEYEPKDIMDNGELLVYVFPDMNKSEMQYLGIVKYDDLYDGAEYANFERLVEMNQ